MERNVYDIFGITEAKEGDSIPIHFSGIGRIAVPVEIVDRSGISLVPGQEVVAGLADGGLIVDLAPAPRSSELEVV